MAAACPLSGEQWLACTYRGVVDYLYGVTPEGDGEEAFIGPGAPLFAGMCFASTGTGKSGDACDPGSGLSADCAAGSLCGLDPYNPDRCAATCDVRSPDNCQLIDAGICITASPMDYPLGYCGACVAIGHPCYLGSDCCSSDGQSACLGSASLDPGLHESGYASPGSCGSCIATGDTCSQNTDCCSATDVCLPDQTCGSCVAQGGACDVSAQCCGAGTVSGLACVNGGCSACMSTGDTCAVNDDCCSDECNDFGGPKTCL
jgi:hypothetical protein